MSPAHEPFTTLLHALPGNGHEELILRGTGADTTATLRYADAPPRVFAITASGPRELQPAADEALPGRHLLADGDTLAAALAPLVGRLRDSRLVAWRPGRRAVLRLATVGGETWWLKLLDARGHRRATRLFASLGAARPPAALVRPSRLLPDLGAHLAPQARGTSLRTLLQAGTPPPLAMLCRALVAIGGTRVHGDVPRIDFATARDAAVGMLTKATPADPTFAALATRIAALPAPRTPTPPAFVHGDLHDKQIFVHDHGADVIDLEGAGVGDARVDLTNLAEHLRLRDLQQSGEDCGLGDRVLAGCGVAPDDADTVTFRLVVRARLCAVYALRPRWAALTARLRHELDLLLPRLP